MTLAELMRGPPRGGDDPGQAEAPYLGSWSSLDDPTYKHFGIWDYAGYGAPNLQGVAGGDQPAIGRFAPGPGHEENGQWVPEDKYRGIVSYNTDVAGTGGDAPRPTVSTSIDWSKLPAPTLPQGWEQFRGGGLMPVKGQQLLNPGAVYNDPNYGPMTPFANRKTTQGEKIAALTQAGIMAAAGGAFGSLVGPAIAGGLNLAGTTMQTGELDPVAAVGYAAGLGGVDPRLISLAKLAYGYGTRS